MHDFPPFEEQLAARIDKLDSLRAAQKRSAVKIKVTVPIITGGYRGQRDAWEESTDDYVVTGNRDNVILTRSGAQGNKIILSLSDIEAALSALDNIHPGGPGRVGS